MSRHRIAPLALALMLAACASTGESSSQSTKAKVQPTPELQRLAPMIGTWAGTATIVSPAPQERAAMGLGDTTSMSGGGTYRWALGGNYLEMEGWHERAPGQREYYHQFFGWDASARKYHSWYFGSTGERGEGWMTIDPDGKTFRTKADGVDATGAPNSGTGTMTLVSDREIKWTWSQSGPQGTVKLEGTNKKK